jgi:predicted ATPase
MRCPQCQGDNRDTAKFCEQCGSRLVRTCPGCGQEASLRANFCPDCGTRLSAAQPSLSPVQSELQRGAQTVPIELTPAEPVSPQAERRQLTVLFCDLVESTMLAGQLDPEVLRGLTALVGRELEVTLLLERWAQVQEGVGQVVWLSGEPGIGKSRLVGVLKDHVAEQPHTRLECRCSPYHQQSALYPVIDLLQRALAFSREDTSDDKVRKLEAALASALIDLQESVPLLAALLSLPLPERYASLALSPQRQRQRTLETLLAVILELASQQPVLFIVEDLHWIDPSTLEFLTLLVDQGPTARIFTLATGRPEFRSPWGTRAHLTPLTLNRLPRRLGEVMVERVAGDKPLPSAVVQHIVSKTDGVPLFMEELTKMVLESGLLREAEDRYELTGPLPPLATYLFKHALIQEAAYQSLLKSTRQRHHQQVAQVLEQRFPATAEVEPELLAHRYTQAELLAQAIPYWQPAGERAMQRSAYVEAISHLTRGLEALKPLPDTSQRAHQELGLQIALGQALTTTKGQAAAEVGEAYGRARELCQEVQETPQLVQVL